MRHEFHERLDLSAKEERLLENHSMLNLFNILELQLAGLAVELPDSGIHKYARFCLDILFDLPNLDIHEKLPEIQEHCRIIRSFLDDLHRRHPGLKILDGLIETTRVGHARLEEFEEPRVFWKPTSKASIYTTLRAFLEATSTVSGDRFAFTYAPEPPRSKSYWIDFQFGFEEEQLQAPGTLNDTVRDLVSNSRKYSEPGTSIRIRMDSIEYNGLKLTVADQGIGIPEDELPKVIQYGYRATNAMDRRTMGGGLGLTKAYQLSQQFGGNFVVESEVGKGTRIEMTLYPPS